MSEPADRILAVAEEHYKRVEAERDSLKAQVAELRSALRSARDTFSDVFDSGHRIYSLMEGLLAAPNPGADLLAKAAECDRLHQELAQLKESNDAACKGYVEAVDRILVEKKALEKFVWSQPCDCKRQCSHHREWLVLGMCGSCNGRPEAANVLIQCERCKALGEPRP